MISLWNRPAPSPKGSWCLIVPSDSKNNEIIFAREDGLRIIYHLNLVDRRIIYKNYLKIGNLFKYYIMLPDFTADWIKCRLYRKGIFWLAHLEFIANWFAELIGITSVYNASGFIESYISEASWTHLVGFPISWIYFWYLLGVGSPMHINIYKIQSFTPTVK